MEEKTLYLTAHAREVFGNLITIAGVAGSMLPGINKDYCWEQINEAQALLDLTKDK
jgi:hypothetical protein